MNALEASPPFPLLVTLETFSFGIIMQTSSKKVSFTVIFTFLSLLLVTLAACSKNKGEQPANKAEATPVLEAQAKDETPDAQDAQAKEDAAEKAPAAADIKDTPSEADATRLEFPKLDARSDGPERDAQGNDISITYFANADEPGKRDKIESQIREAGFTPVPGGYQSIYEKVQGNQVIMIQITEGEGELQIDMTRTRDPQNRYKDADPRIPYPLDQGFAAEYGKQKAGDEGDMIYTYYNRSPEFLADYEKRLVATGFKIVRNDKRPLYTKKLADNVTLTVLVIKLNDRGSDMKIVMGAVSQDVDLTDNSYDIE